MPIDIVMPRLSDSMEEGTVLSWMKAIGDRVELGEELVEIETDKANMVFESDVAGILIEIIAAEGDTLPIGDVIARVGEPDADVSSTPPPNVAPISPTPATGETESSRVKASPLARRIARDKGVELAGVRGSGPGGRIIKSDVEAAASGTAPASPATAQHPAPAATAALPAGTPKATPSRALETAKGSAQVVELDRLQQTVSRRMAESKAIAPHFYLQTTIDMSSTSEARARLKASAAAGAVIPSFNDMVIKACAIALRELPRANGAYRDGRLELYSRVNIGIAVAARDALVVPTIFDADEKGLMQIATEARALAARVREGTITPPELSGGTFTVSNLGMYGITNFGAVINPPQAAILAVGAITETAVVRSGELTTTRMMGVTMASDHRILYGADAARFLGRVRALLEEPLGLAL